jgi:hypothetical protein
VTEPFEEYRGTAYLDRIDPDQRKALHAWQEILRLGQGTLVDGEYFINSQIYLCKETAAYIYSAYTPTTVNYPRGSRPVLDKIIESMGILKLGDFERMLWLMRFIRDLPAARAWDLGVDAQNGGTEEELIQKRVSVCNETARLMVTLCQVAGLPARYVGHHLGGHGVTEIYVDGHWSYCDVQQGRFFLKKSGPLASTWEIWQKPAIIRQQPDWVRREVHPRHYAAGDPYLVTERTFFHPKECTGVVNYFIADHARFNYARDWPMSEEDNRRSEELSAERDAVRRRFRMYKQDLYSPEELREFFGVEGKTCDR